MTPRVVLVTGVNGFLGAQLAMRLASDPDIERVLCVDTVPPSPEVRRRLGRAEFIRADIRNRLIAKVIAAARVDTVVHTSVSPEPVGGGRALNKELNVIGTMQLLAACQTSPLVRRVVLKSTSAVYGSSPRDPAVFTERTEPRELPSGGYAKDAAEIEGYLRGFARRRPDVVTTTLRFSNFLGPRADTVLSRYFALPAVPVPLGHDPRLQLVHTEDAVAVTRLATLTDLPGVYNVAGDGVLTLTQAVRRAGRLPVALPRPALRPVGGVLRRLVPLGWPPESGTPDFGQVMDTTSLRENAGFVPRWSTAQVFDDFVRGRGLRPWVDADRLGEGWERIRAATVLGRR
ncbi:NAD-dependent epimerase/dehydratase family protein [Actinoalloteichus spitiensis]|uniref:NAD-dependent epimerase/dehydratase family protein n=1 Tax=Actinoalloteichus spitiensis TaxID=252394 RepID=UPI000371552C|nr:NAD-dependent epimerase/dehydratase family protein [Actinoalloteichus spitiensis]